MDSNTWKWANFQKAAQMENIQKAQQALADKLGITDNPWFCYPYGTK